jgi:hypothetical protein
MSIFTYHLVKTSYFTALKAVLFPPSSKDVSGLIHIECMACMTLGSPIFSTSRILAQEIAVFAQWENEIAIENFLQHNSLGKTLAKGWHTRLKFVRQWGHISGFVIPEEKFILDSPEEAVVAVTVARMKMLEVPRFLRWGRPVEKLVRDHSGTTLSLASIRFPRTISTFSVWKSQKEMTEMVFGHSKMAQPKRHIDAMKERDRKDFHIEFTTLRFKAISEFGEWKGQRNYIPNL